MNISVYKFGELLNSRPTAREHYLRIVQMLSGINENEEVVLDLKGVEIMTPSYASELFQSLTDKFGKRVKFMNPETPVVVDVVQAIVKPQ